MAGGGGGGDDLDVSINLTALLDVISNLLFFLLFSFASSSAAVELEGGIVLPESTADVAPKKTIQVMVGKDDLRIEKDIIVKVKDGKVVQPGAPDTRIEALHTKLVALREQHVTETKDDDKDILFVLADKDTPYSLLKRVMMTGAEAGFPKFRMAVITK